MKASKLFHFINFIDQQNRNRKVDIIKWVETIFVYIWNYMQGLKNPSRKIIKENFYFVADCIQWTKIWMKNKKKTPSHMAENLEGLSRKTFSLYFLFVHLKYKKFSTDEYTHLPESLSSSIKETKMQAVAATARGWNRNWIQFICCFSIDESNKSLWTIAIARRT